VGGDVDTVFVSPERCIGCLQCELACAVEHSVGHDEASAFLESPVPRKRVHVLGGPVSATAFPNKCRHCDPAPCQQVCPTGAISRDADADLVLVDAGRCIGCAMCAVVCPFDVISFHPLTGGQRSDAAVAVKCDGCVDRVHRGVEPACSEVCKVDALVFGDLNELTSAGRLRESAAVLAASAVGPGAFPHGDPLAGLHAWGEARVAAGGAAASAWERRRTDARPIEPRPDHHHEGGTP
jgi:carbon-monoxide dehydrogenase iron sulfur subunit